MSNIFKNTRFMMGLSIVCGIASLVLGGISLYYKEYIIGGALIIYSFVSSTIRVGKRRVK